MKKQKKESYFRDFMKVYFAVCICDRNEQTGNRIGGKEYEGCLTGSN